MTAALLYRIGPAKRMQRYYRLDVQPDLFGQWCMMPRRPTIRTEHSKPR
jgi:hypothetical protein